MSNALIRLQDIRVGFGGQAVLQDVQLSVKPGEIVTLIGPNGAGKTTLVRAVLGLLKPDSGTVWRTPKLRIGYMPQKLQVDASLPLSVLRFLRLVPGVDRPRALAALAEVGAPQVLDSPLQSISGGELQRVLLALALEPMPNILILDEPLSGVDVEGMSLLMDMLDEIRKKFDLSILMTTHDFTMLEQYCDQVVLLQGKILRRGTPLDVLNSEEFAQAFHMGGGAQA